MATHAHALPVGTRIDDFTIGRVLGEGGFCITYKGFDSNLQCDVAIKEYLPSDLAMRDQDGISVTLVSEDKIKAYRYGLDRFLEEARTLAKFKNANIVRISRFMERNSTAYIVMDYEDGEPLNSYIKKNKDISEDDLLRIFLPILNGLRSVHAKSILHRDIKPSNIYLRKNGSPVLIDFGSARQALTDQEQNLTQIVTPGYAPFEQYNSRDKQGPWTDLYALGATMYHCVTKKKPTGALDRYAMVHHQENIDPLEPAAEACSGKYNPTLLSAIDWMLQLKAEDRPQEIDDVLKLLTSSQSIESDTAKTIIQSLEIEKTLKVDKVAAANWDPGFLSEISVELSKHIGPVAKVLIKRAANELHDVDSLMLRLAESIEDADERADFLEHTKSHSTTHHTSNILSEKSHPSDISITTGPKWSAHQLDNLTQCLLPYIGPMAKIMVKKASLHSQTLNAFLDTLAEDLTDPQEKNEFLKAAKQALTD